MYVCKKPAPLFHSLLMLHLSCYLGPVTGHFSEGSKGTDLSLFFIKDPYLGVALAQRITQPQKLPSCHHFLNIL
jgi:hypothetical protein